MIEGLLGRIRRSMAPSGKPYAGGPHIPGIGTPAGRTSMQCCRLPTTPLALAAVLPGDHRG